MPPSPTFLILPSQIRLKIYIFADLIRLCPISLNNEGSRKAHRQKSLESYDRNSVGHERTDMNRARNIYCDYRAKKFLLGFHDGNTAENECICPPLPIQLLRVCRTIHDEVLEILYSQNKFKLLLERNHPLAPKAVARMTSLCIRLNMCSCTPHHFCQHPLENGIRHRCDICHALCKRGKDPPLSITPTQGMGVFSQWLEVCKILQTGLGPEMRLSVICDCADMETAQEIVKPMGGLPTMSECSIRLGQSPFMQWRQIAESTVLLLTDRPLTRPFRFLDLPRELQRDILCCTDLISPYVLEWNSYNHACDRQRGFRPFEQHDLICCMQCTDAAEACCCAVNHAAFSSIHCTCWSYPAAIFCVSRDMNREATVIFFSGNRFLVREEPWPFDQQPGMRQALAMFHRLPLLALRNLRWIRFNLGFDTRLDVHEGSTPLEGWKETAEFMARNLLTSKLTIELDLRHDHEYPDPYCSKNAMEVENDWKSYQNMAGVFIFEDGPKDYFVHIGSPNDCPSPADYQLRLEQERTLEKRIMGPEYDSEARGKYTNRGVSVVDVARERPPVFAPDGSLASWHKVTPFI